MVLDLWDILYDTRMKVSQKNQRVSDYNETSVAVTI
jgi:hypothetical protein